LGAAGKQKDEKKTGEGCNFASTKLRLQYFIAVKPFFEILLAATGNAGKFYASRASSIGPDNFTLTFDDGTGWQLEAESYRGPGLELPKRTDSHAIFTQVSCQSTVMHAIIVDRYG